MSSKAGVMSDLVRLLATDASSSCPAARLRGLAAGSRTTMPIRERGETFPAAEGADGPMGKPACDERWAGKLASNSPGVGVAIAATASTSTSKALGDT